MQCLCIFVCMFFQLVLLSICQGLIDYVISQFDIPMGYIFPNTCIHLPNLNDFLLTSNTCIKNLKPLSQKGIPRDNHHNQSEIVAMQNREASRHTLALLDEQPRDLTELLWSTTNRNKKQFCMKSKCNTTFYESVPYPQRKRQRLIKTP